MRTQLSLFVPPSAAAALEAVRRVVDPLQATLPSRIRVTTAHQATTSPPPR